MDKLIAEEGWLERKAYIWAIIISKLPKEVTILIMGGFGFRILHNIFDWLSNL